MIAAIYTVLCLVFLLTSFGKIQVRVAEALTILPVFSPLGGIGVTVGCLLSNFVGSAVGATGLIDCVVGTIATGIASWMTWKLRLIRWFGLPILATLPPVFVNAIMIGAEISWIETNNPFHPQSFSTNALLVGVGQLIPCVLLGLMLYTVLERTGLSKKIFPSSEGFTIKK